MVQDFSDFDKKDWQPHTTAQRFECGSPNMMGIVALRASTALLHEIGMDVIERQVLTNSASLSARLQAVKDIEILSPLGHNRRAGIVLFKRKHTDTDAFYRHLQEHNVICARRGEGIRFSPHFYTTEVMLGTAVDRVREYD